MRQATTSILIALILVVAFASCKNDKKPEIQYKELIFHEINNYPIDSIIDFKKVQTIALQTSDDILISGKYKLKIADNYIFILDQGMGQMYRFDMRGNFLNKIGKIGKGPKEYIKPCDFHIDTSDKTVEILNGKQTIVSKYKYSGEYISRFKFDFLCLSFIKNNHNRYYFYCGVNGGLSNKYRIIYTDSAKVYSKLLKNIGRPGVGIISDDNNMLLSDANRIFLKEHFLPDIYQLRNDSAIKILKFNFGKQTINHKDLANFSNLMEFYKTIIKDGFYGLLNFYVFNNKFIARIHYQKQNEESKRYFIFYNVNNQKIKKVLINKKDVLFWEGKFHGFQNNKFIFSIDAFKIKSIYKYRPIVFSSLKKVKENDNPIIFIINDN